MTIGPTSCPRRRQGSRPGGALPAHVQAGQEEQPGARWHCGSRVLHSRRTENRAARLPSTNSDGRRQRAHRRRRQAAASRDGASGGTMAFCAGVRLLAGSDVKPQPDARGDDVRDSVDRTVVQRVSVQITERSERVKQAYVEVDAVTRRCWSSSRPSPVSESVPTSQPALHPFGGPCGRESGDATTDRAKAPESATDSFTHLLREGCKRLICNGGTHFALNTK
jgi:hypothetical protein